MRRPHGGRGHSGSQAGADAGRAGGSYVVARENFGPRVAQVAAVALLIDYVVTVAVQTAAGWPCAWVT